MRGDLNRHPRAYARGTLYQWLLFRIFVWKEVGIYIFSSARSATAAFGGLGRASLRAAIHPRSYERAGFSGREYKRCYGAKIDSTDCNLIYFERPIEVFLCVLRLDNY